MAGYYGCIITLVMLAPLLSRLAGATQHAHVRSPAQTTEELCQACSQEVEKSVASKMQSYTTVNHAAL